MQPWAGFLVMALDFFLCSSLPLPLCCQRCSVDRDYGALEPGSRLACREPVVLRPGCPALLLCALFLRLRRIPGAACLCSQGTKKSGISAKKKGKILAKARAEAEKEVKK